MSVDLRPAELADMDLLFAWVNDPGVRANSFQTHDVSWEEHQIWFRKKIQSADCKLYIACQNDQPVGQLRLDINKQIAYISYSVASQYRGRGIGAEILLAAQSIISEDVTHLVGKVKPDNIASCKAFNKAGFAGKELEDYIEFVWKQAT